jgi:hypothetical protein
MSIEWLFDLEREINYGKDYYACPGPGRNQWVIKRTPEELRPLAQRAAQQRKLPVNIVRLAPPHEVVTGETYLVPTKIGDPGARGEPHIEWSTVETREAAELMRDLRNGASPYFGMQIQETVEPNEE